MSISGCIVTTALLFAPPAPVATDDHTSTTALPASALNLVDRALFRIETPSGVGSGFQYRNVGYVLTNRHVVDDVKSGEPVTLRAVRKADDGTVGLGDTVQGTVRFKHPELDVAVIELSTSPSRSCLKPVGMPSDQHVPRGVELYAHGFPKGDTNPAISRGMLSSHWPDPLTGEIFYMTDTALSPGNSGGPVTNSIGEVVGVATAVSIVADGAGNSWGYVLPIRAIEQALSCSRGLAALPRPFDVGRHQDIIRASRTADAAAIAYAKGVREASRLCASRVDYFEAISRLIETLQACDVPLTSGTFDAFNDATLDAGNAILTRIFEFDLLDAEHAEDARTTAALRQLMESAMLEKWTNTLVQRCMEPLTPEQRGTVLSKLLSAHASGVSRLLKGASGHCDTVAKAIEALRAHKTDRERVKAFARSMATLVQTDMSVASVKPETLEPDPSMSPSARDMMAAARRKLEDCSAEWAALPNECRESADSIVKSMLSDDAPKDEAPESSKKTQPSLASRLQPWTDAGFQTLGAPERGTASGGGGSRRISFDKTPAVVWVGIRSDEASDFTLTLRNDQGDECEPVGAATQGDIVWIAWELKTAAAVSVDFKAAHGQDYPFELAVVYRVSELEDVRKAIRQKRPDLLEVGSRVLVLGVGDHQEIQFDSEDWNTFLVNALDVAKNDVDIEILDTNRHIVAQDTSPDHFPVAGVRDAEHAVYTIRFKNPSGRLAFVEFVIFGEARSREPGRPAAPRERQPISNAPPIPAPAPARTNDPEPAQTEGATLVSISDDGGSRIIDQRGKYAIDVRGSGNSIAVASGNQLTTITVSGSGNSITVQRWAKVDRVQITGDGNSIMIPADIHAVVDDRGQGNSIQTY